MLWNTYKSYPCFPYEFTIFIATAIIQGHDNIQHFVANKTRHDRLFLVHFIGVISLFMATRLAHNSAAGWVYMVDFFHIQFIQQVVILIWITEIIWTHALLIFRYWCIKTNRINSFTHQVIVQSDISCIPLVHQDFNPLPLNLQLHGVQSTKFLIAVV